MDKEGSDLDVRGIALNSKEEVLLGTDFEQVVDVDIDTTVYSFNFYLAIVGGKAPPTMAIFFNIIVIFIARKGKNMNYACRYIPKVLY